MDTVLAMNPSAFISLVIIILMLISFIIILSMAVYQLWQH